MSCSHRYKRRRVMKWMIGGIGAGVAAMLGVPVMFSGFSPVIRNRQGSSEEKWASLGVLDKFPIGEMKHAVIGSYFIKKGVYVWRKSNEDIVVYSRSCTDLGCPIKWDEGSHCFFCPCHGGIFSKEGERMAGPPKIPLYRYKFRLTNNLLEIDLSSVPIVA